MSHISRLPLPSISLVLTTDHTRIPRRPSVVEIAPISPPVIEVHDTQFDPMETVHARNFEIQPYGEEPSLQEKYDQSQHVVYVEDVESEDFTLAQSVHEGHANAGHVGKGKVVKRKMARALSSFRRVFCIDLLCNAYPGRRRRK